MAGRAAVIVLLACLVGGSYAAKHSFAVKEKVVLWANKGASGGVQLRAWASACELLPGRRAHA